MAALVELGADEDVEDGVDEEDELGVVVSEVLHATPPNRASMPMLAPQMSRFIVVRSPSGIGPDSTSGTVSPTRCIPSHMPHRRDPSSKEGRRLGEN